jgi:hypothetical protein
VGKKNLRSSSAPLEGSEDHLRQTGMRAAVDGGTGCC